MKLSNKKLIDFLNIEFNKIGVQFDILQNKHKYKNKFYRGYIYINNWMSLTDEQNEYIDQNIYSIIEENNWSNLWMIPDNITKDEIIKKHFPIYEEIEYDDKRRNTK